MSSHTWPAWHPESILRAEDLLGLEDYLLARSAFAEKLEGVERLGGDSVIASVEAGDLVLTVGNLTGLTPGGQPVMLQDDFSLRHGVGDAGAQQNFDLSVVVNQQAAGPSERPRKLSLSVVTLDGGEGSEGGEQELYLGRYEWDAGARRLSLAARPAVTRLRALKDTEGWEQWTAPLRDRLSGLIAYLEEGEKDSSPRHTAALHLAYAVGFGWPHLPIPRLAFSLQMLNWLLVRSDPLVADCDVLQTLAPSRNAERLPARLAEYVHRSGSDFPGQELRPEKEVSVGFELKGERVVYTFLQALRPGCLELHLREQDAGDGGHPGQIRWGLISDTGVAIVRSKDEDPVAREGALVYTLDLVEKIPQPGYQLKVSGVSEEAFERTRLFFIQARS